MSFVVNYEDWLAHYGRSKREGAPVGSGRYPLGSGEDPDQHVEWYYKYISKEMGGKRVGATPSAVKSFLESPNEYAQWYIDYQKQHKEGRTVDEICSDMGLTVNDFRKTRSHAREEYDQWMRINAIKLHDEKGWSEQAIAKELGKARGTIHSYLQPGYELKRGKIANTVEVLKEGLEKTGCVDVGSYSEAYINVSRSTLDSAIKQLKEQGYKQWWVEVPQITTPYNTTVKVLGDPNKISYAEVKKNPELIMPIDKYTYDSGKTYETMKHPTSVSSKDVEVIFSEDGGSDKDGLIELRRGVPELSLGSATYAQVRIAVDDSHYMKGMAVYSDELPSGVNVRFYTSKTKDVPILGTGKDSVLKPFKTGEGSDINPFGATVKQREYTDENGNTHLSAINIVRSEGEWEDNWSRALPSQFLSKQSTTLAQEQLRKAYDKKAAEFDEIMSLSNPILKKNQLMSFAEDCDSDAVHLKGAAMDRQAWKGIIPMSTIKPDEVYAPGYENGEKVVLVRFPHAGRFEIPELTVNNNLPEGKKMLGNQPKDAIGIHKQAAAILSGADFDGDTVLIIPNNTNDPKQKILVDKVCKELSDFEPKNVYAAYEGMPEVGKEDGFKTGFQMGIITNLITDMCAQGVTIDNPDMVRAVKHSMVVIDAEKHNLNWKASEEINGIKELHLKYQGKASGGASTLLSKTTSQKHVPLRKEGAIVTDPKTGKKTKLLIDPETGDKLYTYLYETDPQKAMKRKKVMRTVTDVDPETNKKTRHKEPVLDENGNELWIDTDKPKTFKTTKMAEAKDARELSSGSPMEEIYAAHANRLKDLARKARLETLQVEEPIYSPAAAKEYAKEVNDLKDKLHAAHLNDPVNRRAIAIANSRLKRWVAENPLADFDEKKKRGNQFLTQARADLKAGKKRIEFTDREWEAIQAGAVKKTVIEDLFRNADSEKLKARALPKTSKKMSPALVSRARQMLANPNATLHDVAEAIGVSVSTLQKEL